jgi:ubiquinone/menaquinone biosynthesis C-methylase UbiE
MDHASLLELITQAVRPGDSAWADFGAGDGAFTRALRTLLGSDAEIYAVDSNGSALRRQQKSLRREGTQVSERTHFLAADFTRTLELPPLDGGLIANALHYVDADDQVATLRLLGSYLKPSGRLTIVEYDMGRPNPWVPFPVPFESLTRLAAAAGYGPPARLATVPTRFGRGGMYSAMVRR